VSTETILFLLPELLLIACATAIYVGGAFAPRHVGWSLLAVAGVVGAAVALAIEPASVAEAMGMSKASPLVADAMGQYVRWLTLVAGLLFVLMSLRQGQNVPATEYLGTLLMALAGVMLVGSARELVLLFLGLELLSIPTYVLLYLGRRDLASQESAVKYFFLSILSSAFLLYGFSFLYGVAGSTDLAVARAIFSAPADQLGHWRLLAQVSLALIFAGLGFRIAAVPFHFYAPDVYQGTTNANAGLLAVFPKIVGFVALVRLLVVAMPGMEDFGWRVALVLAILTMTLGNVLALWQDNLRRLLAYSSIAHAGYMLIGLAAGFAAARAEQSATSFDGVGAMLFYLGVYVVATTGTFAALAYLGTPDRQIDHVDELAGVSREHPWAALAIAAFMFSLAGIPPLAGFWGKLTLFASALGIDGGAPAATPLRWWFVALTVIGALNAAVAAAYYLRIISVMYFRSSVGPVKAQGGWGAGLAMLGSAVLVLLLGCYPVPLVRTATAASESSRAFYGPAPVKAVAAHAPGR
jgi:NADH-quinone oxidoreductase subunit N